MVKDNKRWSELFREEGARSTSRNGRNGGGDDSDSSNSFEDVGNFTAREVREILRLRDSDHPGMQLVSSPLTGNNFYQWSRSIKRALGARSKLELLDGSLPEPEAHSKYYKAWIKAHYMIFNWIINSISKDLANAFNHLETTHKYGKL